MFQYLKKIRKSYFIVSGTLLLIFFGNVICTTFEKPNNASDVEKKAFDKFAGSATCANCHKDIYESHIKTAHYLDSRPAAKEFIKGSFSRGKNKFVYNKFMEVVLEQKKDSFFQTAFISGTEYQSKPFDIVIGSGRKGQTYLYWDDDKLFQLPVSYFTNLNSWCNSPGFPMNLINFDRLIPAECLECHGTYAKAALDENQQTFYDKTQIIYGIDCERCHGGAAKHVAFQQAHPEEKTGKYIISMKQLTRQQQLDACALCHSGFRDAITPRFTFETGDTLDNYSVARYSVDSISTLDVHGNQYGLLMASKCFKNSAQLDCSSCHNVHENEVNSPKIFSQRCITCHTDVSHASLMLPINKKQLLRNNCIDCHMPMLPSGKIILNVANAQDAVHDEVRTHKIGIYPVTTKDLLQKIQLGNW